MVLTGAQVIMECLLEQGVDINVVRQLAGHADISTTTRYDCRGRQAVDRASRALCCW